jgi:hypothetical protein
MCCVLCDKDKSGMRAVGQPGGSFIVYRDLIKDDLRARESPRRAGWSRRRTIAMTDRSRLDSLVGKYFMAPFPHDDGVVELVIDEDHCLVRFEPSVNGAPEALAVVALSDMVRAGNIGEEDEVPHWLFFDSLEDRAKYRAWVNQPDGANKPRIVYLRPRQLK